MKNSKAIKPYLWKSGIIYFLMIIFFFGGCATQLDSVRNTGQVTRNYSDGSTYVGEFMDSKRNGQGTITFPNGSKYVGGWKDDNFHGQGTITWPDGSTYVGEFMDSKRNGQGTYTYSDGSKYVGGWKDSKRNGQGTITYSDGSKYVGGWKDDKHNGQGTYTWPDGSKYVGDFRDGESENNGIYTFSDGSKSMRKLHFAAKIVEVSKNTQGERIGLLIGDTVIEYNDIPILSGVNSLVHITSTTNPQDQVKIRVLRNGKEKSFVLSGGKIGISIIDYPHFFEIEKDTKVVMALSNEKPSDGYSGQKWAVIIGISKYKYSGRNGLTNLIFADDDAKSFTHVLRKLGWSEGHIKLLINDEATQRNILIALESWLTKAGPNDQIVLFWAGHGFPDPEDPEKVYFACYDTDISIPATGYRMDKVRTALEERKAKNVVLLFDTCHAGKLITRGDRGISIVPKIKKMHREQKIPKGWIFMVGADTDRKAIEHTSWKNGAFTHCLINALSGKADGFLSSGAKDGVVTMAELRSYLNNVMPDETQRILGVAKRPVITTSTGDPDIWNLTLQTK